LKGERIHFWNFTSINLSNFSITHDILPLVYMKLCPKLAFGISNLARQVFGYSKSVWTLWNRCQLRDRPFNLKVGGGMVSSPPPPWVRIFFQFLNASRDYFFQFLTLFYMVKILSQIISPFKNGIIRLEAGAFKFLHNRLFMTSMQLPQKRDVPSSAISKMSRSLLRRHENNMRYSAK
jgi:hypothetical protein